ncbi:hypothetical protein [Azohydromonas australica]|uniref:hypothetical protein n=1 Tax=Azohydromonas australica TaxID=364039 RepID=UPI0012EC9B58|nr:hypothetical protein [Azohydromonas australica]
MGTLLALRERIDAYQPASGALQAFRFWHVENLLNQSADLLDRCMSARSGLRTLEEKLIEQKYRASILEAELIADRQRLDSNWFQKDKEGLQAALPHFEQLRLNLQYAAERQYEQQKQTNTLPFQIATAQANAASSREYAELNIRQPLVVGLPAETDRVIAFVRAKNKAIEQWLEVVYVESSMPPETRRLVIEDQVEAAARNIEDDFADAYNRAATAHKGLQLFYGRETAFPFKPDPKDISLLDQLSLWVRTQIRWLTATLQLEEIFTRTYSLKQLIGDDFQNLLESWKSTGTARTRFQISLNSIDTHRYIRFRGISVSSKSTNALMHGQMIFPRRGVSIQLKGGAEVQIEIPQEGLPPLTLGRIESQDKTRAPEISGVNLQTNASIFGDGYGTQVGLTQRAPSAPPGCAARLLDSWTASRV